VRWIDKLQQMGFSLTDIKQIVRDVEQSKSAPHAMQRVQDLFQEKARRNARAAAPPNQPRERADGQPRLPGHVRHVRDRRAAVRLHQCARHDCDHQSPDLVAGFRVH
jgi:DNA-binding transcriptional MerR regulator